MRCRKSPPAPMPWLSEGAGGLGCANGAVFLDGGAVGGGPLQRRAELETLAQDLAEAEATRDRTQRALEDGTREAAAAHTALAAAGEAAEQARREELDA